MKNAAIHTNTIQMVHKTNHVCSTMTMKVVEKKIFKFSIFSCSKKNKKAIRSLRTRFLSIFKTTFNIQFIPTGRKFRFNRKSYQRNMV